MASGPNPHLRRPRLSELGAAFGPDSPGGTWSRAAFALGLVCLGIGCVLPLLPRFSRDVAVQAILVAAALTSACACMGARRAATGGGRATWQLLAIGAVLAAGSQIFYAHAALSGTAVPFPSMGFHLLVAFHIALAEGAILALRPAQSGRTAIEIAFDGMLVLLVASAVVLRFALDEPLVFGWLSLSHVVAILVGEIAVAASILFVGLLVLWRDTPMSGSVVDALMITVILFAFGDSVPILGLDAVAGARGHLLELVRVFAWIGLMLTAALATVRPEGGPSPVRREVTARRFRQLIMPGVALFMAAWAVDAVRRGNISSPSLVVISLIGLVLAGRIGAAFYAMERESADRRAAEQTAALARLRSVTARMHPHFLFNALHSLSALVRRDTVSTERALERLGGLLRYGLDADDELVSLGEEWAFAQDYLGIETMRLRDRLVARAEIEDGLMDLAVPPFIVQPLLENAIRHGVNPYPEGGEVSVTARREADRLVIEVADSGEGADPEQFASSTGFGVRGVKAQLETHFGSDWTLTSERPTGGGFVVRMTMPADED